MNEEAPERGLFVCRKNLKSLLGDFGQIRRQKPAKSDDRPSGVP